MDNQPNPPAANKLLDRLHSLSAAAHFFLDEQNRGQQWQGWSFETTQAYLQEAVFNLRLAAEESAEFDFEKFLDLLDRFLASGGEDSIESIVPTQVLENLTESLDEAAIENEELVKKIQDQNEARLAYLQRQQKYREELNKLLQAPPLAEEEIQAIVPKIAEELQPEMAVLKEEAERAETNEALRPELREKGQAAFEKAVQQIENLSPAAKNYLLSRELSAETIALIAASTETDQAEILIKNALSPLTETERKFFQENIIPALAANAAFLGAETTPAETEELTASIVGQKVAQLAQEGVPQDKILNCLLGLSEKTQELVSENPKIALEPTAISPVAYYQDQVFVPLTSPATPGNNDGEVYKLREKGNSPGQDTSRVLKNGSLIANTERLQNRASEETLFKLTILGVPPEELEKAALFEKRTGRAESLKRANHLQNLAVQLRQYHQQYFSGSSWPQEWVINRLKATRAFSQISAPAKVASQKLMVWLGKSSIGQAIKTGLEKTASQMAQKSLQALWTSVKTGTSGATLGRLGLQAVVTVVFPGIGNVAAALITLALPKLIKKVSSVFQEGGHLLTSGFGLTDAILGRVAGRGQKDETKWLVWVFVGLFVIIFVLPLLTTTEMIGGSFITGKSEGPWNNPQLHHYPEDLQCPNSLDPKDFRHLAEEVACLLSGCGQIIVNFSTLPAVSRCFSIVSSAVIPNKDLILQDFRYSLYVLDENGQSIGVLQCVGFVTGIQHALTGKVIDQRNACQYCHGGIPAGYQRFAGENFNDPQKGDIAVWDGRTCGMAGSVYNYGHVAIVVDNDTATKTLSIAQANYDAPGLVNVSKNIIYGTPNEDRGVSPGCFLRYTGQ